MDWVLPCFQGKPFMAHILQRHYLFHNLFLGQLFPGNMLVFQMVRAIFASIDAVIRQVQRGEHYNPVPIKIFFNLLR